jgi:hypothetical protein
VLQLPPLQELQLVEELLFVIPPKLTQPQTLLIFSFDVQRGHAGMDSSDMEREMVKT